MNGFTWPVAVKGYEWLGFPGAGPMDWHLRAIQKWPLRHYEPLKEYTGLFWTFAKVEPTKEGVLAFANQFGVLGAGPFVGMAKNIGWIERGESDDVLEDWEKEIPLMRKAIALWERTQRGEVTDQEVQGLQHTINQELLNTVSVRLVPDVRHGGLTLRMRPFTLLGALWLQLAEAVSGNKEFRSCPTCGKWFELNPDIARTNRQFCSDACRTRAYRGRKEQAQKLAKKGKSIKEIAAEVDSDVKTVKGWIQSQQ
jgi:hypothetical protein